MSGARHLYVHLPFCAHKCGYCDFVTVSGRRTGHGSYVDALLAELDLEHEVLGGELETVFLGGGTPTFTEPAALERLLRALPQASEVTVEANPETVTPQLVELLRECGVNRVSLGAQTFQPELLATLERRATPDDVRGAVRALRYVGAYDNVSLDLIYAIPGQGPADLERDLSEALALEPEHLSCYELEAKPGTRFTHAHAAELARQSNAMEAYFEQVVETVTAAGYRWYETANFCRRPELAAGRDLRARHNLAYWWGRDYLGLGIGAVSTVAGQRWRNTPSLAQYLAALGRRSRPPREVETLSGPVRRQERLLLGLRLDDGVVLRELDGELDFDALGRLTGLGLARRSWAGATERVELTERGRFLGDAVTAALVA